MAWTDEQKAEAIQMYKDANPTAENSTEIVKKIAEDMEQSPNGLRMILVKAGVYVNKQAATSESKPAKASGSEGTKRVSKETAISELAALIEQKGAEVDTDILDKLTGKAAQYFTKVLSSV